MERVEKLLKGDMVKNKTKGRKESVFGSLCCLLDRTDQFYDCFCDGFSLHEGSAVFGSHFLRVVHFSPAGC